MCLYILLNLPHIPTPRLNLSPFLTLPLTSHKTLSSPVLLPLSHTLLTCPIHLTVTPHSITPFHSQFSCSPTLSPLTWPRLLHISHPPSTLPHTHLTCEFFLHTSLILFIQQLYFSTSFHFLPLPPTPASPPTHLPRLSPASPDPPLYILLPVYHFLPLLVFHLFLLHLLVTIPQRTTQ